MFKKAGLAILLVCGFIFSPAVYAATFIAMDSVNFLVGGSSIPAGCAVDYLFRLNYTPGDGSHILGFSNGFRVWTFRNGLYSYTDNFEPLKYDTLPIGWVNYADNFFMNPFGVDGLGEDTVLFAGNRLFAPGIPDGFDTLVWYARTIATTDGDTLCIDSSWCPPSNSWLWATDGPLGNFTPNWLGPYCFAVTQSPGAPPQFTNCPERLVFSSEVGEMFTYTFCAVDSSQEPPGPVTFRKLSGPGELTTLSDTCAFWSYVMLSADSCVKETLLIQVTNGWACDECFTEVYIDYDTPVFTEGCGAVIRIEPGQTYQHKMTATSVCEQPFYFLLVEPPPAGTYDIDDEGLITFQTDVTDTGRFVFTVCASNNAYTSCCDVYFYSPDGCCHMRGDVNDDGGMNVLDITFLVAFLFKGGAPPPCWLNADVGGNGDVNVSDLTYLVRYLFQGGSFPPPCP